MGTISTVATNGASTLFLINRKRPHRNLKANMDERKKKKFNSKSWVGSFVYLLNLRPVLLQAKIEQFGLFRPLVLYERNKDELL